MKSLKSMRKGANRRMKMKNPDGSPIHYVQKDEAPVFEEATHLQTTHTNADQWRKHATRIGAYIEDHGHMLHAFHGHKHIGLFQLQHNRGVIREPIKPVGEALTNPYAHSQADARPQHRAALEQPEAFKRVHGEKAHAEALAAIEAKRKTLPHYPYAKHPLKFTESLTPERAKEAQSKAGYHASLATSASKAGIKDAAQKHEKKYERYSKLHAKEEVIISLEQLEPIFEALADVTRSAHTSSDVHSELAGHAKAMAHHMKAAKAEPHNLTHHAKVSDIHDTVAKKHGHEAARYVHIAAQAHAAGNEHGAAATVKGAAKHAAAYHSSVHEAVKLPVRSGAPPQLQSNHGLKKWRKQNPTPGHTEQGSTKGNTGTFGEERTTDESHPFHVERIDGGLLARKKTKEEAVAFSNKHAVHNHVIHKGKIIHQTYGMKEAADPALTASIRAHMNIHGSAKAMAKAPLLASKIMSMRAKLAKQKADSAAGKPVVEAKVPDYIKAAARDSLRKQGYKVDMQLRTATKKSKKQFRDAAVTGNPRDFAKEEVIFEAGSSKTKMKRKYLGKTKGRTALGTPAHAVDTKPTLNIKDAPTMKVNRFPTPSKGI